MKRRNFFELLSVGGFGAAIGAFFSRPLGKQNSAPSLEESDGASRVGYMVSSKGVHRFISEKLNETVSIDDFGASPFLDDNSEAIYLCAEYCHKNKLIMEIPNGEYCVKSHLCFDRFKHMRGVSGKGLGSKIRYAGDYVPKYAVLRWANITGKLLSNFLLDCNDLADIGVDTSWHCGVGPSLQNDYFFVLVQGHRNIGWLAENNNDCPFVHCVVRSPGRRSISVPVAVDIKATGGFVSFVNCFFPGGKLKFGAQNLYLSGGFYFGISAEHNSYNIINAQGAYVYSGPAGCCFGSQGDAYILSLIVDGGLLVLQKEKDSLISGRFDTLANFRGSRIDFSHSGVRKLYSSYLTDRGPLAGRHPVVRFEGGSADGAILNEEDVNSRVTFEYDNFYIGNSIVENRNTSFQVCFSYDGGGELLNSYEAVAKYDVELYNHNRCFKIRTASFVCKRSGVHQFNIGLTLKNVEDPRDVFYLVLDLNEGAKRYYLASGSFVRNERHGELLLNGTISLQLSPRDSVRVVISCSNDSAARIKFKGGEQYSHFSGYRVST